MVTRSHLWALRNQELLSALSLLVRRGNELTSDLLAHLAEVDERRLHLELGFPSLFAYCTRELGLCESAAGRRIVAARVCRKFSDALARVARGDLHLSALCALNTHLNQENAAELFELCSGKTRRQIDELLAARFPKPDVRESIRRLPNRAGATSSEVSRATQVQEAAVATAPIAAGAVGGNAELARELGEIRETRQDHQSGVPQSPTVSKPSPRPTPTRHTLEPLSAERFGVHFTADAEFRDLLERAGSRQLSDTERRSCELDEARTRSLGSRRREATLRGRAEDAAQSNEGAARPRRAGRAAYWAGRARYNAVGSIRLRREITAARREWLGCAFERNEYPTRRRGRRGWRARAGLRAL
jgi:hypothetical protein